MRTPWMYQPAAKNGIFRGFQGLRTFWGNFTLFLYVFAFCCVFGVGIFPIVIGTGPPRNKRESSQRLFTPIKLLLPTPGNCHS